MVIVSFVKVLIAIQTDETHEYTNIEGQELEDIDIDE